MTTVPAIGPALHGPGITAKTASHYDLSIVS